jgi:hypothetical protein
MGKVFDEIDQQLRTFIEAQHVFFVATSPLDPSGHINLSPKGLDSFRIVDPGTVAYLDFVGSGAETIAHLRENRRIVVMFCAFDGSPKILRLHGSGEVLEPRDAGNAELRGLFTAPLPDRSIIRIRVTRISDSCGFGVPRYAFQNDRAQLSEWSSQKGTVELTEYQIKKNRVSVDGLPALRWAGEPSS